MKLKTCSSVWFEFLKYAFNMGFMVAVCLVCDKSHKMPDIIKDYNLVVTVETIV